MELTHEEASTVHLALAGWVARCDAEQRRMLALAEGFGHGTTSFNNAMRNAEASKNFADDARKLLKRF